MKKVMMNLQETQLNQVSQVYVGKDNCCRCGCGGTYYATSFMENPRSAVNDLKAQVTLNRAKRMVEKNQAVVEYGDNYVNVSYGNNRAITLYLNDLKK